MQGQGGGGGGGMYGDGGGSGSGRGFAGGSHHYPSNGAQTYLSATDHSYPHQSSLSSGTPIMEPGSSHPRMDGFTDAQGIRDGYRQSMATSPSPVQPGSLAIPQPAPRGTPAGGAAPFPDPQLLLRPQSQGYEEELESTASHNRRESHGYDYSNPYDADPDGQQHRPGSPSIGPWDSASQRSVLESSVSYNPHPLPSATSVPLSGGPSHLKNKPSLAPTGLSYIDEEGTYYKSDQQRPASMLLSNQGKGDDLEMRGLVGGAGPMAMGGGGYGEEDAMMGRKVHFPEYEESPNPYPLYPQSSEKDWKEPNKLYSMLLFPLGLDRLLALFGSDAGKFPLEQAIERKKRGLGGQRWPVATYVLVIVMTAIMIFELVKNNSLTGSPIATKPNFNYMIGPQPEVLINIGARFPPCMKLVKDIPPDFQLACLNDTNNPPTTTCTVEEICGHGGFHGQTPDQSWRFVLPIFLHVGIIHLLVNMFGQIVAGSQVEREMGTVPFLMVYVAGGIYGFVLGGNFVRTGIPSLGASGALFAIHGCVVVDLAMHWKYEERPKLKAFLLFIEFCIGVAIGYIPFAVDGLAHLGGFAMGILMGTVLYPSISETKRHRYAVWVARVTALVLIIVAFVLTIKNFYTDDPNAACEWCRFLSCIPTSSNDRCSGTGLTTTSNNVAPNKRSWDAL